MVDSLSRAHLTRAYLALALEFIHELKLLAVDPCTHILSHIHPPILSRSGVELAGNKGVIEAGIGPSTWDEGSTAIYNSGTDGVLLQVLHRPRVRDRGGCVPVAGVPGKHGHLPGNDQEQGVSCPGGHEAGRGLPVGLQPHTGHDLNSMAQ